MHSQIKEVKVFDLSDGSIDGQKLTHVGRLKLVKKSETSGHIRTSEVFGKFALPKVGSSFIMIAEAYDKSLPIHESYRVVRTSTVVDLEINDLETIEFKTLNSVYQIEDIEELQETLH